MAEITVLAEEGGVSRADFLGFLNDSVMGSMFTRYKSPAYVNLDFKPTFTPSLLLKDFHLGFEAARELEVSMQVAAATEQIIQGLVGIAGNDVEFGAMIELVARASGLELDSRGRGGRRRPQPAAQRRQWGRGGPAERRRAFPGRRVGNTAGRAPVEPRLEQQRERLLEALAQARHEAGAVDAVDDPMVAAEAELDGLATDDLAGLVDDGTPAHGPHGEDRRLRGVDDRREAVDAVHPEVPDAERRATELTQGDREPEPFLLPSSL